MQLHIRGSSRAGIATTFAVDAIPSTGPCRPLVCAGYTLARRRIPADIIGYLLGFDHYTFYANGRVAWVEELMVAEAFRRQRIGQTLLREFEGWAAARGAALVALATRRAAAFYLAAGYEESAIYFRKRL